MRYFISSYNINSVQIDRKVLSFFTIISLVNAHIKTYLGLDGKLRRMANRYFDSPDNNVKLPKDANCSERLRKNCRLLGRLCVTYTCWLYTDCIQTQQPQRFQRRIITSSGEAGKPQVNDIHFEYFEYFCGCAIVSRYVLTLSPPIPLRLYTLPYWSNPPFLIFDIRALWRSGLSARAPECQKSKTVG